MKMPAPMMPPITIIVASNSPNCRASFGTRSVRLSEFIADCCSGKKVAEQCNEDYHIKIVSTSFLRSHLENLFSAAQAASEKVARCAGVWNRTNKLCPRVEDAPRNFLPAPSARKYLLYLCPRRQHVRAIFFMRLQRHMREFPNSFLMIIVSDIALKD